MEPEGFGTSSVFRTALHEVGHSLNLHHTIGRRPIMNGGVGAFFDFGFNQLG